MQDSMYTAMFGAMCQEHRLAIIANNLANVNTTGFKKEETSFKDVMVHYAHDIIMEPVQSLRSDKLLPAPKEMSKVRINEEKTDFSQGSLKKTDGPLDLGLGGEGFFKIRTENGDLYSRNGHFLITAEGQLVTPKGYSVLGTGGGEITIPTDSNVLVGEDGSIIANGEIIDQVAVVTVTDLDALEKVGENLFRLPENSGATEAEAADATVFQGFLEASNVNVVLEMVNMIEAQRQFEAYSKIIHGTNEIDSKAITKVGEKV